MLKDQSIYLAPFQGITGSVFREIYTRHFPFVDKLFTPFFTNIYKRKSISQKVGEIEQKHHNGIVVVPQVLSNDAIEIIRFGGICGEMGFKEINWNLGCPAPRVAAKKRGSGLLPYPEMVNDILVKVMPQIPVKLSIKCRLGYQSYDEIFNLIPIFNLFELSELIIHARIGKQIYKGVVNLGRFEQVMKETKNTLIYNGDIFNQNDFKEVSKRFAGISGWMIGRGLLADPFLPGDIKGLSLSIPERHVIVRKFIDDLYFEYRKKQNDRLHVISVLKELWEYLSFSFDRPGKVFNLVKKTKSFDEYEDAVNRIFDEFEWLGSEAKQFNSDSI